MKAQCLKISLLSLLLMKAFSLHAGVIVGNLNEPTANYFGPLGSDSNTNDFLVGQEFSLPPSATPYRLTNITLLLSATGGGANITASIWQVGPNNNPSNELAVVSSQFVAHAGNTIFVPTNQVTLPPGIYYVVASPTTPADSGFVRWAYATTTNWTGSGNLGSFADTSNGVWENSSVTNGPQQLSVAATPMPPTLTLTREHDLEVLSWSRVLDGFLPETTTNLAAPTWQPVTNPPSTAASQIVLTNTWKAPKRFFRLRQSIVADNLTQPVGGWGGPIGTDANSNDCFLGQMFTLSKGNYWLKKITLRLDPVNGPGTIAVSIWHVGTDNNPANEIAVVASQRVTQAGEVTFVPATSIPLSAGNYYVVAEPATAADNALVGWDFTYSISWTGFAALGGFADTYPGVWENAPLALGPYQMSVKVTPAAP